MDEDIEFWSQILQVDVAGQRRLWPLMNECGRVYPTLVPELMVRALRIQPHERVLDVGGGNRPFPRANVVVDLYVGPTSQRNNQDLVILPHQEFVQAPAEKLPFADQEFDLVWCCQTLEHVDDPAAACEELMRVAKRGFIDTPRGCTQPFMHHPDHKWLIHDIDGVLYFERKRWHGHPFNDVLSRAYNRDPDLNFRIDYLYRNLSNVQLEWTGRFRYHIVRSR